MTKGYQYPYRTKLWDPMSVRLIEVPTDAVGCVIRGRHAEPVRVGPDHARSLTPDGIAMAMTVQIQYRALIGFLGKHFAEPAYWASNAVRSIVSTALATGAEVVEQDSLLNLTISIAKAPDPEGCHANFHEHCVAKGIKLGEMFRWVTEDPARFGDQPVEEALAKCNAFNTKLIATSGNEGRFKVTFDHEPANSLWARRNGVSLDDLGLDVLQAYIIFLGGPHGHVLSVQKFYPDTTATLPVVSATSR